MTPQRIDAEAPIIVIGGGPAGLTAAYEVLRHGGRPIVLEKSDHVGGIARTEQHNGCRFDIGGHRFFTKVAEVQRLWNEVLPDDLLQVSRLSRIFYGGRFYQYPLSLLNTFRNLGAVESVRIALSYLKVKLRIRGGAKLGLKPLPEDTLEQWVTNRFGLRLYRTFFKTYTEKVWGIPCSQIRADWAAQRIKGMSLKAAVLNALFKGGDKVKSLITKFDYPRLGPGQMWERFAQAIDARGGEVRLKADAIAVRHCGGRATSIVVREGDCTVELPASHVITSMPLPELIRKLDPPAPPHVRAAAEKLSFRDFLLVGLVVREPDLFPDNWIYVHSPDVKVGRIQNFGNWSQAMVPDPSKTTSLGMEYFCTRGDALWEMSDDDLIKLAKQELTALGLAHGAEATDGCVIRQEKAYPVYDVEYAEHVETIRTYLATFANLQTVGRNGMHRYNNQDHSMLTALLAVRNIYGERHDLWTVNVERSYHEEFKVKPTGTNEPRTAPAEREVAPAS
ncbi:MAG: NAD(P)/FAD-dependent oxidoreductase [Tepidisphaeraceae bacterium]